VKTRVVNVRTAPTWDIYVGRGPDPKTGARFYGRIYGNPYSLEDYTPAEAMRRYFAHLERNEPLMRRIRKELPGKVLGCWCKPSPCHGDVLAALADGKELEEIRAEWADILAETQELF